MRWLLGALRKFARLFNNDRVRRELERAVQLANVALPIVSKIADLTPTRADNAIIDLFRYYGLPHVEAWLALPESERGPALAHVARTLLLRQFPGEVGRIIDLATQTAYTAWQADRERQP